ncbi:gamma-glutamylcyclotransferase [Neorhizobium sp. NPDC001467]|uniref:gamma-glutamylcyclotransferase n=1 Tax=Neorhizobium sp. NPDC001467 TaxID=3390595 RepID=UPI003CFF684A
MDEFWVFGYGSLMWNPGFEYEERMAARAFGYRRSLCVRSFVHRGTPEKPGLVLGLDRGGSCRGVAFRVRGALHGPVMTYLAERELVTNVYRERMLPLMLANGVKVSAVGYVVDRGHLQYAGALGVEEASRIVHASSGRSGPNDAYVLSTLDHLREMGIRDLWLEAVGARVHALQAQDEASAVG